MPRYESPIATSLADAFASLGTAWGQKITRDRQNEQLQNLLNQLMNARTPGQPVPERSMQQPDMSSPSAQWGSQNLQNVDVQAGNPMSRAMPNQNLQQYESQPQGMMSEANLPILAQFLQNPQGANILNLMGQMQPKTQFINQEGGGLDVGRIYPSGRVDVERKFAPRINPQLGWGTQLDTSGSPMTFSVPGTDDVRTWEQETDQFGKPTGRRRLATGGSPPSGGMMNIGRERQLVPTNQGFRVFNKRTNSFEDVAGAEGLGKPPTNEMIQSTSQIATLKGSLDRVKELYKPEYVGAFAGRLGGLQEATTGLPPEQASFYADLADIQNTLIYLKSGKQINENEYQRLLKQLPDKNNPESVFNARMTEFERVLNQIISSKEANMQGYGGQRGISQPTGKKVVRTGVQKSTGKKVIQYDDGTTEIR